MGEDQGVLGVGALAIGCFTRLVDNTLAADIVRVKGSLERDGVRLCSDGI